MNKKNTTKLESLENGIELNSEQKLIQELVLKGESICFTGSAGTGKSFLLRHLITFLQKKYGPNKVGITSLTGTGASIIGGTTLASYFGLKSDSHLDADTLFKRIISPNFEHAYRNWRRTKVLIIDEISMLDGELFDKLESLARSIRMNFFPFGKIQLILVGDFCQLPPVTAGAKYCFEAQSWPRYDIRLGRLSEQQQSSGQLAELTKNCLAVDHLQLKVGVQGYPVVKFTTGQELAIKEHTWEKVVGYDAKNEPIITATRTQIPLILAWALTIHKSQGQTIERLKVDLS
ncbi:879_t:CDS:2, partial [Cetraspora pellucida]